MRKTILSITALVLAACLQATSANAQATRTWVSGVGDDVNPCSRTAPCKTFAGAIAKTAAGGIISCLDPGGFGAVTITKSMTIDCEAANGGILASGTSGVIVNAADIVVNLRNIIIEGAGNGLIGVNFINGAVLNLDNVKVMRFQAGSAIGVKFTPAAGTTGRMTITNSLISDNDTGVLVKPVGSGNALASIVGTHINSNDVFGVSVDGVGVTGYSRVNIRNSSVNTGRQIGISAVSPGGGQAAIVVDRTSASNNGTVGLYANGNQAFMYVSNSTITGNNTGLSSVGGNLISIGDNVVNLNLAVEGTFNGSLPKL